MTTISITANANTVYFWIFVMSLSFGNVRSLPASTDLSGLPCNLLACQFRHVLVRA